MWIRTVMVLLFLSLWLVPIYRPESAAVVSASPAWGSETGGWQKLDPQVRAQISSQPPVDQLAVIVRLQQPHMRPVGNIVNILKAQADAQQGSLQAYLAQEQTAGQVARFTPLWIINGLAVTAGPEVIQALAAMPEVARITPDLVIDGPEPGENARPTSDELPGWNLAVIGAPELWEKGWRGQGIVVANMDTGVSLDHPDLAAQWRGGQNSWFDPYGRYPDRPVDLVGHGTWTMGVMVGGTASGRPVGVAPEAQWIAVKIFDDPSSAQGAPYATASAIHLAFQWLLDPDGNPATADAPDVVNGSWTSGAIGCNLEFIEDVQALRAAGILPVFAAGNYGPEEGSAASPANYPESFATGALDISDSVMAMSSRGPSDCGGPKLSFPNLSAPGADIFTTDLHGFYTHRSGTSMAAPHVAGGLALLLSAYPHMGPAMQELALQQSAVDLSPPGPDNDVGSGRLDLAGAYQWLSAVYDGPKIYLPYLTRPAGPLDLPAPILRFDEDL